MVALAAPSSRSASASSFFIRLTRPLSTRAGSASAGVAGLAGPVCGDAAWPAEATVGGGGEGAPASMPHSVELAPASARAAARAISMRRSSCGEHSTKPASTGSALSSPSDPASAAETSALRKYCTLVCRFEAAASSRAWSALDSSSSASRMAHARLASAAPLSLASRDRQRLRHRSTSRDRTACCRAWGRGRRRTATRAAPPCRRGRLGPREKEIGARGARGAVGWPPRRYPHSSLAFPCGQATGANSGPAEGRADCGQLLVGLGDLGVLGHEQSTEPVPRLKEIATRRCPLRREGRRRLLLCPGQAAPPPAALHRHAVLQMRRQSLPPLRL
eukprot:scaffold31168_cov79-Isochrysis_galbana.AAC.2